MTLLISLRVKGIIYIFRLVLEEKPGKEILESLRLEFLETLPSNNFVLEDANTLLPSKRESIADIQLNRDNYKQFSQCNMSQVSVK